MPAKEELFPKFMVPSSLKLSPRSSSVALKQLKLIHKKRQVLSLKHNLCLNPIHFAKVSVTFQIQIQVYEEKEYTLYKCHGYNLT